MANRKIQRIITSSIAPVGTFTVRRALPDHGRRSIGPWVFLDHFGPFRIKPGEDGVGPHPHAGIETVTYLLNGRNQHRDSAGHEGIVSAGGAQWMTSGRGVIHSEAPLAENEAEMTMHGIQLWTTLPRDQKLVAPSYQCIETTSIPTIKGDGAALRVIAGEFGGVKGPARVTAPTLLWHVRLQPGVTFTAPIPSSYEIGVYVIDGMGAFSANAQRVGKGQLVVYDDADGEVLIDNASTEVLELLFLGGTPAEGPLVFHGPFVMNSVEQVRQAEQAFHSGAMGQLN